MGRQLHFHMLPEDRNLFLGFVQEHDQVTVILRDSDSPDLNAVTDFGVVDHKLFCLWNHKLLPDLEREWVSDPGYFRINILKTPTLEFGASLIATWEGKPALIQGRLFGDFDAYLGKPREFDEWYEMLTRWVRKNFRKSPASSGGYVGPAAYDFYTQGGYLLPQFLPPRTEVWLAEIAKQHKAS